MFTWILKKIIGSKNQREVRRMIPLVAKINEIEAGLQTLPDEALRDKTAAWKAELSLIQDPDLLQKRLNEILPESIESAQDQIKSPRRTIV